MLNIKISPPRKVVLSDEIDEETVRWVVGLLKMMGIPGAEALTLEDFLAITDEEVEACFKKVYGRKNGFNLSKVEKRCLYLIHQNCK